MLLEMGIDNIFGRLWGRDGLSRRDRSLVTLASGYAGFPAADTVCRIAREVLTAEE